MALLWKMICNLGDPMSLRHPVLQQCERCSPSRPPPLIYLYRFLPRNIILGVVFAPNPPVTLKGGCEIFLTPLFESVCVYVRVCVHTYVCVCVHSYACPFVWDVLVYIYIYIHICIYIYMERICIYMYMYIHVSEMGISDIYIHICIYIYIERIYIYIYVHVYPCV